MHTSRCEAKKCSCPEGVVVVVVGLRQKVFMPREILSQKVLMPGALPCGQKEGQTWSKHYARHMRCMHA